MRHAGLIVVLSGFALTQLGCGGGKSGRLSVAPDGSVAGKADRPDGKTDSPPTISPDAGSSSGGGADSDVTAADGPGQPGSDAGATDGLAPADLAVADLAPADLAAADAGDEGDDAAPPGSTLIRGTVQLGSFERGTKIEVIRPAQDGSASAAMMVATTTDDFGNFSFILPGAGAAEIIATGKFYDQRNNYSRSAVTLRALVDLRGTGRQQVAINVLTHATAPRARKLWQAGMPLANALAQAETELQNALGHFVPRPIRPAATLNLWGGDDASNAYLMLVNYSFARDPDYTRWLNQATDSLEVNGTINPGTLGLLNTYRSQLDPPLYADGWRQFLVRWNTSGVVPNLDRALDLDRDGIADISDPDADGDGVPGATQKVVDGAGCLALRDDGTAWNRCTIDPYRIAPLKGVKSIDWNESSDGTYYALQDDGTVWSVAKAPSSGDVNPPWQAKKLPDLTDVKAIFAVDYGTGTFPNPPPPRLLVIKNDGTVLLMRGFNGAATEWEGLAGAVALAVSAPDDQRLLDDERLLAVAADGRVLVSYASDRDVALPVPGLTTATAVFMGPSGVDCALKADRTVWCWGYQEPQGRMPKAPAVVPELADTSRATGLFGNVTAVKTDGSIWLWRQTLPVTPPWPIPGFNHAARARRGAPLGIVTTTGELTRLYVEHAQGSSMPIGSSTVPVRLPR